MVTLTERFNRLLFQRAVKKMTKTPTLSRGANAFAALTMVHQRDVLSYLLAIKTFAHFAQPERIILVADPSMDDVSKTMLRKHIPFIEILDATAFRRPALPVGGTWERLSAISVLNAETPIVQLDADTVTFDFPAEVVDCMRANRSFIIRSEHDTEIQTLDQAAEYGRHLLTFSQHVVAFAEASFTELPNWQRLRYARGCSGFTGFGKGHISPDALDQLSGSMRSLLGAKWDKWGSEQVSSNLLAATTPDALLLPHPKYCNADQMTKETVVAHFIGYARHVNREYEQRAKSAVHILQPS
ncbi:MAG: hypothetical protein QM739_00580 [Propionivibrio sp.]